MAKQPRKGRSIPPIKARITPKIIERGDRRRSREQASEIVLDMLQKPDNQRQEIQGILFGALTVLLFFSLITQQFPIQNIAGKFGELVAQFLFTYFGYIAYIFPIITLGIALDKFRLHPLFVNTGTIIGACAALLSLCALFSLPFLGQPIISSPGGEIGVAVAVFLKDYLNTFGTFVIIITGLVVAVMLFKIYLVDQFFKQTGPVIERTEGEAYAPPLIASPVTAIQEPKPEPAPKTFAEKIRQLKKSPPAADSEPKDVSQHHGYQLPPLTLLDQPATAKIRAGLEQNLLKNSRTLEEKLLDFGIEGKVIGVLPGPVITQYEFQPAPGIKVSRIVNLSDDLALAMKAIAVRIVAPVPGKDVVGVEVPNEAREIVCLREILETKNFLHHPSKLVLGFGKDIGGKPYIADLTKMPHLLIAGATGSGKSVCLNSLICSILFHATPAEVRFIMIDPKMLELGIYDDIPHMLIPVVKSPQQAANALGWATQEMTRRYGILAQKGVRNVAQYNEAVLDFRKRQHIKGSPELNGLEDPLPYIVIIIDELADLMMVSAGVERPITRLAQMARAVGIHLILATQRPSVDVITGLIKANFPARISFRVSSKVDSRTILDANGAEVLLGDGDMLFLLPGTSRIRRLHGSFVSEKEIKRVTTALKKIGHPHYDENVLHFGENEQEDDNDEALYEKAVRLVVNSGEASVSMLRRVLKIGHSRASRLIAMMEQDGIVSEFKGSRPREIIVKPDQLAERLREEEEKIDN